MGYTAIIMAGTSEKDLEDPLLIKAKVKNKALIKLNQKPMVRYILEAIDESNYVSKIILVGLTSEDLPDYNPQTPLIFLESKGSRVDTLFTALEYVNEVENPDNHVLVIPSDVPLISTEILDKCIEKMNIEETDKDLYFGVLFKSTFDKKFPNAQRHFRKLKEGEIAGGDIHAVRVSSILKNRKEANDLLENRKSLAKQILKFSPLFIIRYLFRRLSIDHILEFFEKEYGVHATHYVIDYPEAGMDLDYAEQLERFETYLQSH